MVYAPTAHPVFAFYRQEELAAKEAQKERDVQEKAEALKLYGQREREKTALQLLKQVSDVLKT